MVTLGGLTLVQIMLMSCYLVTGTDQNWKWHKSPYGLDGPPPPKYLRSAVYKPAKSPSFKPLTYSSAYDKLPYSSAYDKLPYSSAYDKPSYSSGYDKPSYSSGYDKHSYTPVYDKPSYPSSYDKPSYPSSYDKPSYPPAHDKPYLSPHEKPFKPDHCELRKVIFTQDAESPQYIVYKTKVPDLKEFTLCHWHNIFNYTHDQPIFAYTHPGKVRGIFSWIENAPDKTYYSLAINGHTIYRINYPEKLFKWYHVCQSWNGMTGEWQLWINSERVGRGFYNLMVGKLIKGGGVAISGREYLEQALAVHRPSYSGELTLVTLYKAALTAGKAYNDHKHHHVHNFHHGYDESVDEAETEEPPMLPAGPMPTRPPHLAHGGPFANGQLLPKLPVEASVAAAAAAAGAKDPTATFPRDEQLLFDGGLYDFYAPFRNAAAAGSTEPESGGADDTFRVNLLDRSDSRRNKRNATGTATANAKRSKGSTPVAVSSELVSISDGSRHKRNATGTTAADANRSKRWTPVAVSPELASISNSRKYEPAEWEVMKVGAMCSACEADPFGSAAVLSWHETRKQFFNGALYLPALPKCFLF